MLNRGRGRIQIRQTDPSRGLVFTESRKKTKSERRRSLFKKIQKMQKKKISQITLNNYTGLLTKIQKHISETQSNILNSVTREKVVMGWKIGKVGGFNLPAQPNSSF